MAGPGQDLKRDPMRPILDQTDPSRADTGTEAIRTASRRVMAGDLILIGQLMTV
jgi:hypothetical protein